MYKTIITQKLQKKKNDTDQIMSKDQGFCFNLPFSSHFQNNSCTF